MLMEKKESWCLDDYCSESRTRINIPEGVRIIEDVSGPTFGTFFVERIDIPESVKVIADGAFNECESLKSIKLPMGLEKIGAGAFGGCSSLKKVIIPASVTYIGECAFSGCINIREFQVHEDNPNYRSVNGVLFNKDCTELLQFPLASKVHNYEIPSTVVKIVQSSFADLQYPTCVTIPSSVTEIEGCAFDNGFGQSRILLCVEPQSYAEEYCRRLRHPLPFKNPGSTAMFGSPLGLYGLRGRTFCVTGKLNIFGNRDTFAMQITPLGGSLSDSVTQDTDYLVTNTPDSGSSKNKKAAELGIPVLNEETFLRTFFDHLYK